MKVTLSYINLTWKKIMTIYSIDLIEACMVAYKANARKKRAERNTINVQRR